MFFIYFEKYLPDWLLNYRWSWWVGGLSCNLKAEKKILSRKGLQDVVSFLKLWLFWDCFLKMKFISDPKVFTVTCLRLFFFFPNNAGFKKLTLFFLILLSLRDRVFLISPWVWVGLWLIQLIDYCGNYGRCLPRLIHKRWYIQHPLFIETFTLGAQWKKSSYHEATMLCGNPRHSVGLWIGILVNHPSWAQPLSRSHPGTRLFEWRKLQIIMLLLPHHTTPRIPMVPSETPDIVKHNSDPFCTFLNYP